MCEQIEQKIHANADNQRLPQEFPDWRSCVEDRDATIYKLSAAVVNLCQMVEYKNTTVMKRSAPVHDWFNPSTAHQLYQPLCGFQRRPLPICCQWLSEVQSSPGLAQLRSTATM